MARVLIGNFKGPQGIQGVQGRAGTMKVGKVSTLQPGEAATVANTGTTENAILDFGIPRGDDGMTDLVAEYKDSGRHTAQPTAEAPVVIKGIKGKTVQVETTGAQLFDASKIMSKTANGVTFTNNNDGSFTISGSGNISGDYSIIIHLSKEEGLSMFREAGSYYLGGTTTIPYITITLRSSTNASIIKELNLPNGSPRHTVNFTQTDIDNIASGTNFIQIGVYGASGNPIVPGTVRPMLNKGSTALPWEPYSGGKPSPSPEYPQEVRGVGDAGSVEVVCQGRNLFDGIFNTLVNKDNTNRKGLKISTTGTYTISNYDEKLSILYVGSQNITNDNSIAIDAQYSLRYGYSCTIECIKGKEIAMWTGQTLDTYTLQIERGAEQSPYQPYHGSTITIPLSSPLYAGDRICYVRPGETYVDAGGNAVVADRMLYGVRRENRSVVFDGSSDEAWGFSSANNNRASITLHDVKKHDYTIPTGACSHFDYNKTVWADSASNEMGYIITENIFYIRFTRESTINTEALFRDWLSRNNLNFVYKLATPYFEPFSDQSLCYALRSATDLTYIYTTDPLEPEITVDVAKNQAGAYLLEGYARAEANKNEKAERILVDIVSGQKCFLGMENGLLTVYEEE